MPPVTRRSTPSRGWHYMPVVVLVRLCFMCRLIPTMPAMDTSAWLATICRALQRQPAHSGGPTPSRNRSATWWVLTALFRTSLTMSLPLRQACHPNQPEGLVGEVSVAPAHAEQLLPAQQLRSADVRGACAARWSVRHSGAHGASQGSLLVREHPHFGATVLLWAVADLPTGHFVVL